MMRITTKLLVALLFAAALNTGCKPGKTATSTTDGQRPHLPPAEPAAVTFAPMMGQLPTAGMWKCDPAFADVDGDGLLDLAAVPRLHVRGLGNGPRFWFADGAGGWRQSSSGLDTGEISCGGGLEFADINGDGFLDLAVADHCQGVFVYLGDGQGNWDMATKALYPESIVSNPERAKMYTGAEDLAVADINGDGYLDLVVGASDLGGIQVYLGNGSGEEWTRASAGLPEEGWATRIRLPDIDGDGDHDVVAAHADGPRVWLNDGTANFTAAFDGMPSPMMRGIFIGLSCADFNIDGRLDVAVANWIDGPEVYLQQADGSWKKTPDVFPDLLGGAVGLDSGDLDNDGRPDLVVAGRLTTDGGYSRGVFPLLGDGNGRFQYVPESGLPATGLGGPGGVTLADIDGDGRLDVAHGNGLLVESAGGLTQPVIAERLLVWTGKGPGSKVGE